MSRGARIIHFLRKLGIAFAAILLFFTAANIIIDWSGAAPARVAPMQIWGVDEDQSFGGIDSAFRADSRWFWEPNPGGLFCGESINEQGYRGRVFSMKPSARIRIAALGDSSTQGYRVAEEESWPRQLEKQLQQMGYDVEVINFGVVGFSAYQGLAMYKDRVRAYSPDVVLAAFGAVNEHFRVDPGMQDLEKAKILSSARYNIYTFLSRYRFFRWLESATGSGARMRDSIRTQSPASADSKRPSMRVTAEEFESFLGQINQLQRDDGRRFVIINPPRMESFERSAPVVTRFTVAAARAAKTLNIPIADVYTTFRENEKETRLPGAFPSSNDWFLDGVHPSAEGHRHYAEIVADCLVKSGLVSAAKR